MELMAASPPPPEIPAWTYVACPVVVAVCVCNVWVFRTGRVKRVRPEMIQLLIRYGYASVPFLVSAVAMSLALVIFPFVVEYQSSVLGGLCLLLVVAFLVSLAVGWKETKSPSRWNRTPAWLEQARARGEL